MEGQGLERAVLGPIMIRPALLSAVDLSADEFPAGLMRKTFEAMSSIYEDLKPTEIDPEILLSRLGSNGNGTAAFIGSLMTELVRVDPDLFKARVLEMRRRRIRLRILGDIERALKAEEQTGEIDVDAFEAARGRLRELDTLENAAEAVDPIRFLKSGSEFQALDLTVKFDVEKLLPSQIIGVLYGRGGLGKTTVLLQLAKARAEGSDFFGLRTEKGPVVYCDFENPLPLMVERARNLDLRGTYFWHQSFDQKPPKLDSEDYQIYKRLPAGSLIVFDTLRAAHDGDENDSRDMSLVMGRLKEIRDAGFSILVIHHTPRASDRQSKGSTAITDLADHVLSLSRVRQGTFETIEDDHEPGPEDLFRLGTAEKTRFLPHQLFLKRGEGGLFIPAEDPDQGDIDAIAEYLRGAGHALSQTEIFIWAKEGLDISKKGKIVSLLRRGENRNWISTKSGRQRTYVSI